MAESLRSRLINTLVESFKISPEQIAEAEKLHQDKGISLDQALIRKGLISEEDLMVLLVKELHVPFIHLKKYRIDPELQDVITDKIARQYRIVPISRLENTITIAIADPLNIFAIDDLKNLTGSEIDVVMSTETEITEAIEQYYGGSLSESVQDVSKDIKADEFEIISEDETVDDEIGADAAEQAPIIRLVNLMIREALKQRASDIHIEPLEDIVRVRYRIDGVLQEAMTVPKKNQNAVLVRLKIMARLNITASRTPQDGRFKMKLENKEVDFRVSILPTTHGQKVVMRILDKSSLKVGLEGLGFSERSIEILKETINSPFGMMLVTGPTGSGKSTTLYSIINELNTIDKNIITVEDPVEYLIEGLTQIQARPEVGLTFASGLRAILRQSPDIVMVGEIRDFETADIAIKASLTGQMVFSTLHTNDSAGALTRLVDMGVEPFLVSSSLIAVCAQRLCRRICPHCKERADVPDNILEKFKIPSDKKDTYFQGRGCDRCRQTGFLGRLGVTEVLQIDDTIREMLIKGESSDAISHYARKEKGMKLLWDDAVEKFKNGLTSLDEVLRVTSSE